MGSMAGGLAGRETARGCRGWTYPHLDMVTPIGGNIIFAVLYFYVFDAGADRAGR